MTANADKDRLFPGNYQSISLVFNIFKIVLTSLRDEVTKVKPIPEEQFEFRPYLSTE